MAAKTGGSRSGARWGWLLTTLALGAALGLASWANYRSARAATSTINIGQVRVFEGVLMNSFRGRDPGDPAVDLDDVVAAQADAGLRFVGLFSPEDGLSVLGGIPLTAPVELPPPGRGFRLVQIEDRIRTFLAPPPPRGRDRTGPQALIMIEFEPLVAGQLMSRATRSLGLGVLAAGILMLTAFFFWRASLRREAEERVMEEQRRLRTLGELSAVLAHEIRNPLASLKGHAQLLAERTPADAPERRKVDRIVSEALRLEALTTDLLDFVRTGPLDLEPTNVEGLLRNVVSEAGSAAVEVDVSEAPESWPLDAQRIQQVLSNLLDNALAASPEGAPVTLKAFQEGTSLNITFLDQGEGIPEESLDRIFEPFFTTRPKGTGLGLAVARRIVELHGGQLTVRSLPRGGSEFRVTLIQREA